MSRGLEEAGEFSTMPYGSLTCSREIFSDRETGSSKAAFQFLELPGQPFRQTVAEFCEVFFDIRHLG